MNSLRHPCRNNLKQIGLALHNYHDEHFSFPPAYIVDENGRPMHSWRVLILPFLGEQKLYDKYNFDEPWNSPNNSKLGDLIELYSFDDDDIHKYHCHNDTGPDVHTSYVAVVGDSTLWPGTGATRMKDITDGTSNTIMVVEVTNSGIHWMEPRDLKFNEMLLKINPQNSQGISSPHEGGAHVTLAYGAVRFLNEKMSAENLRRLLIINDGEVVEEF